MKVTRVVCGWKGRRGISFSSRRRRRSQTASGKEDLDEKTSLPREHTLRSQSTLSYEATRQYLQTVEDQDPESVLTKEGSELKAAEEVEASLPRKICRLTKSKKDSSSYPTVFVELQTAIIRGRGYKSELMVGREGRKEESSSNFSKLTPSQNTRGLVGQVLGDSFLQLSYRSLPASLRLTSL